MLTQLFFWKKYILSVTKETNHDFQKSSPSTKNREKQMCYQDKYIQNKKPWRMEREQFQKFM